MTDDRDQELALLRGEVEYLKRVIAYEARVIEAQVLDLKALAKCRREVLEQSVEAMRMVARDELTNRYSHLSAHQQLKNVRDGHYDNQA